MPKISQCCNCGAFVVGGVYAVIRHQLLESEKCSVATPPPESEPCSAASPLPESEKISPSNRI